jgi:ABC-2 type transport system ATP-binding protein
VRRWRGSDALPVWDEVANARREDFLREAELQRLARQARATVHPTRSQEVALESHFSLAIGASGLVKTFGRTRAVGAVDLAVPVGSVYGVLGPNGAGKTTTLRMLATLPRPDAGTARVLGHDIVREADAVRSRIALTGQYAAVDDDLTGQENLALLARLWGHRRADAKRRAAELLDAFGLTEAADRLVNTYSGGMRRRLDIAASIVVTPELLFLDEPTTGLDPLSRNQVWDLVRELARTGTTVLLTTQYLDEADQLADRVAVIDHGRVIAEGATGALKASVGSGVLHVRLRTPASDVTPNACWPNRSGWPCITDPMRRRSRRGSPTPTASPMRLPSCPALGSRSPTSRSASPAWTRSSWP